MNNKRDDLEPIGETSDEICPSCFKRGLVFSDDPNQEGWGNTGVWHCPHCGYWITDAQREIEAESDDEFDFDPDDDEFDFDPDDEED